MSTKGNSKTVAAKDHFNQMVDVMEQVYGEESHEVETVKHIFAMAEAGTRHFMFDVSKASTLEKAHSELEKRYLRAEVKGGGKKPPSVEKIEEGTSKREWIEEALAPETLEEVRELHGFHPYG